MISRSTIEGPTWRIVRETEQVEWPPGPEPGGRYISIATTTYLETAEGRTVYLDDDDIDRLRASVVDDDTLERAVAAVLDRWRPADLPLGEKIPPRSTP